jgi:DNA repair exonuclease SbcCD nuclease subunit
MKIACVTDQHFGARSDSITFSEYFDKFYSSVFFPYLEKNNIDTVIDLGDTFDHRKYINYDILARTKATWFDKLAEKNIQLHCIVGNHSTYFKNTNSINSIDLLTQGYSNVTAYSESTDVNIGGLDMQFIPWINSENSESALKMIKDTKAKVAFGHLEINGFYLNSAVVARHGLEANIFNKFDSVYTGHFHKKSDNGTIYYLGTAYQINWSDYGETKGFHVFDTETLEMEFIENPHTILEKIYYDDRTNDYSTFDVSEYAGKIIKVIVQNKTDLYGFDRFITRLYSIDTVDIKILETHSIDEIDENDIDEIDDTRSLITHYVESVNIPSIDTPTLQTKMDTLYTEAVELL